MAGGRAHTGKAVTVCNALCAPGCGYVDGCQWYCRFGIVQSCCGVHSACLVGEMEGCQVCCIPASSCGCGGLRCGDSSRPLCEQSGYICCLFSKVSCGGCTRESAQAAPHLCSICGIKLLDEEGGCKPALCYWYRSNKVDHAQIFPMAAMNGAAPNQQMAR